MEKQLTPGTIETEKLLADLNGLWTTLAGEQQGALLRACSMTLVVTCEGDGDAARVRRMIGVVMREHPSRAILIELKNGALPEGRVFSECHRGAGGSEQICSEGIEIATDPEHLAGIARQIAPLAARDLPVMLWCRGPRVFSSAVFEPLYPIAQRIIVDSCTAQDLATALAGVKKIRAGGRRVADLAWTRLTGWREALAYRLEANAIRAEQIRAAAVRYSSAAAEPCARYLKFWIEGAAPSARVSVEKIAGETGIRAIAVSCARMELNVDLSKPREAERDEAELIHEELSISGADPVFEDLLNRL